jgi:signal transduction histidine kinase
MRVFLSWSGARSRMLSEALRDWLPSVLQNVQPWMSTVDVQMGARWNVDLAQELQTAKVGIICVTSDNQSAPWMLFEAGALSKIVDAHCVIPYLLNIRPGEVQGPLVQFQAAVAERDDTFKVVSTINRALETLALSDEGLERSFEKWWPDLAATIANISQIVESDPPPRPDRELLEEILNLSRQNTRDQVERMAMAESAAQLRQQDLMTMTHQLQGPLSSVASALSSVAKTDISGSAQSDIEWAQELVEDALALTNGIATAFLIAQGLRVALRPVEINVPEALQTIARRIQQTTCRNDLTLSFIEPGPFPLLLLDEQAFTSILYSLIQNAARYADKGSEVVFDCRLAGPDRMPVLTVKSTGEPIRPDDRERVFEKFVRGRQAERGRFHSGVGLGLWVARELMKQLGGDVTLDLSVHNPRVATFVVHFGSGSVA